MSKTMVALDFSTRKEVYEFLLKFQEPIYVKIGMELTYSFGFEIVREVKAMGHQIFLDLKLHDIPNTVKQAMKNLAKLDVDVVNLHAAGGSAMMKAMNEELMIPGDVKDVVISYAKLAKESGLDGVVCSVHEAKAIHEACGSDFLTVTPGIRLADDSKDDQKRVATPAFAKEQGCDYIVVGRSITKSADPVATYHEIEKTMEGK